jgi:hypothetical protein
MWMSRRPIMTGVLILALAFAPACSDEVDPDARTEDELNALEIRPDAPPLERTDTTFYAVKGQEREVIIYFTEGAGGRGTIFFLLRVFAGSLASRPDGTPIAEGDSVLITVRAADPSRVLFDVEPSGLTFDPATPPLMLLHYNEVDPDLDGDGDGDAADLDIEQRLTIWRQETPGGLFTRLESTVNLELDGVGTSLAGFSRYAISY